MPNGNEMAGFYIDKLSLSQRLSIVSETYDRVNKTIKRKLKYSYDDIEMIKKRFVKYIDAQLYRNNFV